MATQINVWVLPNGAVWLDGNNVPATATVPMDDGSFVADVPINYAQIIGPVCPGLYLAGLPKLVEQAERTLREQNAIRTAGPAQPADIVGVKITLNQA